MNRARRQLVTALSTSMLIAVAAIPATAQAGDVFDIAYGDTVADGVPEAGAGNIEVGGTVDSYRFEGEAGDVAILDALAGGAGTFRWSLVAPAGTALFDAIYTDRSVELPATGTYVLTVRGATAATVDTYSFRLLLTPTPEQFAIALGDTVSDGVPAPGAGNLEVPGAVDVYRFDASAGQAAVFDALTGSTGQVAWRLEAPDGTVLFDAFYVDQQATFPQTGTYTLVLHGLNITSAGTYSFRLLLAPAAQEFTIAFGDTVSDGVPAPGAGNLEAPGAIDRYRFDAMAGQVALFDVLTGSTTEVRWRLQAPDGAVLFDAFYVDQQVALPQTGTYQLTVAGQNVASFGIYSFRLAEVLPQIDEFAIDFDDTVSDGVPGQGAGNLEAPGAIDRYRFDATAGQVALLDVLAGSTLEVRWSLRDPDGAVLFDAFYVDQQVTLPETGTYVLEVRGLTITSFGVYSFKLREPPPNSDPIAEDDTAATDHGTAVPIDVLANDHDPDGDDLVVDAVTQPDHGTALIDGALVVYTPDAGFSGMDTFTYTISDGRGGIAQARVMVIVREPANAPPTIEAISDQHHTVGDDVTVQVEAHDADGDALGYSAVGLPPDVGIDPGTGEISGTIATGAEADSPYTVEVTVSDPHGATASTTFAWFVEAAASETVPVRIDILAPCIFVNGFGVVPVVVFGDEVVNVRDIDLATVELEGMPAKRLLGRYVAIVHDVDRDGFDDLLVLINERAGAISEGTTTATLTGHLRDGSAFAGSDVLCVLPIASKLQL